jgi:hypothetical protein
MKSQGGLGGLSDKTPRNASPLQREHSKPAKRKPGLYAVSHCGPAQYSFGGRVPMHVIRKLAVCGASLLFASTLLIDGAGASSIHIVATGHATGQYALAETDAQINKPSNIELALSSKPELSGLVQWTVGCEKNNKIIPNKSYKKTVKFPAVVKVKFTTSSSECTVAANVELEGSGKVTISLESSD